MRARPTTRRWPRPRTSVTHVDPRCTRTVAFRVTSRACSGLASPKKAAERGTDAGGERAEPKVVPTARSCGAFACRREAKSERERRTAEHQRGLLLSGDSGCLWPAQPAVGVPQETIQQTVRKSLKGIKSNVRLDYDHVRSSFKPLALNAGLGASRGITRRDRRSGR